MMLKMQLGPVAVESPVRSVGRRLSGPRYREEKLYRRVGPTINRMAHRPGPYWMKSTQPASFATTAVDPSAVNPMRRGVPPVVTVLSVAPVFQSIM